MAGQLWGGQLVRCAAGARSRPARSERVPQLTMLFVLDAPAVIPGRAASRTWSWRRKRDPPFNCWCFDRWVSRSTSAPIMCGFAWATSSSRERTTCRSVEAAAGRRQARSDTVRATIRPPGISVADDRFVGFLTFRPFRPFHGRDGDAISWKRSFIHARRRRRSPGRLGNTRCKAMSPDR